MNRSIFSLIIAFVIFPFVSAFAQQEAGDSVKTNDSRRKWLNDVKDYKYQMLEREAQMTEEQAAACPFNPFDLTKVWSQKQYPLIEVGVLELNRNPENYFADVEQAAFNPANVVPGISFSPDRMLQGRLFSYGDTQRYRLGVNHHQIPVNRSRCPFLNMYHRDGQMRVDGNYGSILGYEPNGYGEWQQQGEYKEPPLELDGAAYQWDYREDDSDYYSQAGDLFRLMSPAQQQVLFENTARAMGDIPEEIKLRHIRNCRKADENYGRGIAEALGIAMTHPGLAED